MVYLQVLKTAECNSIKAGKKILIHSILKRRDCVIGKGGRGLTLSILFFFQDNFVHPLLENLLLSLPPFFRGAH